MEPKSKTEESNNSVSTDSSIFTGYNNFNLNL